MVLRPDITKKRICDVQNGERILYSGIEIEKGLVKGKQVWIRRYSTVRETHSTGPSFNSKQWVEIIKQ